jgi:O-glycosyl hydrolase
MPEPVVVQDAVVNAQIYFQTIDGFGVNINSRYWKDQELLPAMKLLLDDLGANLYRVDIWGKSNWIDPLSQYDRSILNEKTYQAVYEGEIFQRGWGLMRFLNQRGIRPYLTASGDVPTWMLAEDGKVLADIDSFCEMLVSMVEWARHKENLDFTFFGPLNETDIGSPEGPSLAPREFVRVVESLDRLLTRRGLDDVKLVVAEQGSYNADFVRELLAAPGLAGRLGVFGLHMYGSSSTDEMRAVTDLVQASPFSGSRLWLTEYGDLEQTGDREWYVAWVMTRRLFNALEAGYQAALAWDAFDNYHDHNEAWTIYGLLRTGLRQFTPKKRFYASKQVYRFVKPGFQRLSVHSDSPALRLLAFADPSKTRFSIVGMNSGQETYLNVNLRGFNPEIYQEGVRYYRTSATENCNLVAELSLDPHRWPENELVVPVPGSCIFTLTNL